MVAPLARSSRKPAAKPVAQPATEPRVVRHRRDGEHDEVDVAAEDAELAEEGQLEHHREQQQHAHPDDAPGRQDHGRPTPAVCGVARRGA